MNHRTPIVMLALVFVLISGCIHSQDDLLQDEVEKTITANTLDGVTIYGERYYGDLDSTSPLIMLFHQGGSNGRAEYAPLVDWLNNEGYRAIAWDQRAGGELYGEMNRTVTGLSEGTKSGYCDAYADLQAALNFVMENGAAEKVMVWGSSYSGALVFRLAAENPNTVSAVMAFSPASGGPMVECRARQWVNAIKVPAIVYKPTSEMSRESSLDQQQILEKAGVTFRIVENGIHGSSMLVNERTEYDMDSIRNLHIKWLNDIQ